MLGTLFILKYLKKFNMQNLSTPFSPSNGIDNPSSSTRGRIISPPSTLVSNYRDASSFHSDTHACALAMIPFPPNMPALDDDTHLHRIPLIWSRPLPHKLIRTPQTAPPHALL